MLLKLQNKRIKLRGHHLICLSFFIGKGYNFEFINNVFKILIDLKNMSFDKIVEIVCDFDDVCFCCPNKRFNQLNCEDYSKSKFTYLNFKNCLNSNSVIRDRAVLSVLKFKVGDLLSWHEIIESKNKNFSDIVFKNICGNCRWFNLCDKKN